MVKKNKPIKKKGLKPKRKGNIRFIKQTLTWIVVFTFILSVIGPLTFVAFYHNKIYPNVTTGNLNLSGKTKTEGEAFLTNHYKNLSVVQFHLIDNDKEWFFSASDWGLRVDIQKTIENAYQVGRSPSIFTNILTLLHAYQKNIRVPVEITLDNTFFSQSLSKISEEIDKPMVSPAIIIEKNNLLLTPGIVGRKLDQESLKLRITETISKNTSFDISLPMVTLNPPVTKDDEEMTYKRAQNLLTKKLNLAIGDSVYEVEKQELINLLAFSGDFTTEKIASLTANLAEAFNKDPQNAAFNFENGKVTVFRPGKEGQKLNQENSIPLINQELLNLEATASAKLSVTLPVNLIPPEITTDKVNNLGIKELLGRGVSYFRGSIASRIHNINLASSKLNGILIKPGEIFSFNQALGDVSAATGFQQAYVIQNGRTVLGDGGGVCQVSTTLFRAALNSGLPITQRQAHAYRVAYYEQGFGAGLDATVFAPSVDLKIENNTSAHILIQTDVNLTNLILTFDLYGTSDGRKAFVSNPKIWEQTPPPPPKYEDDPTMPAGQEKQVDWAAWGAKASFDYKVTRGDEVLINKTFYSNFRPWQAVYLRGTKS